MLLLSLTYRTLTKAHHEANPESDDAVYEQIARELWQGTPPPGDFSPGLAPFLALFANPWTDSATAFALARFVLATLLVLLTWLALAAAAPASRGRAAPWVAAALALGLALSPMPFARFVSRPAAACVLALALALAVRGRRPGSAGALCALALGTWLRPEFFLACGVLFLLCPGDWRRAPRRVALALVLVLSAAGYRAALDGRYEDRFFRAFAQHYAWGAGERGDFDGDPWGGWRPLVARDFGPDTRHVLEAARAAPAPFAQHVGHNLSLLPREWIKSLRPFDARGAGSWLTLAGLAALALGLVRRLRADPGRAAARDLARDAREPLFVVLAAGSMLLPWLVVRPRADVLFSLAPASLFVLALALRYALQRAGRGAS